ncbi:helix-turn-helix domain-containing protein [Aliiglaciecola sp. LCG003]|uniref:winged helix-turn-helix transcriptional regulator n=1 Tax=Aliiglaciecola sp. LCG003 TaxID=3053655 RepID=UPI00257264F6|nr:helix-turn-helix domain-containing protein [Aliiglaciecola sp. LCG003]WJG08178.1 helix-turn-helix domain-containing protein [Aliiglaciecola sp. LCG003]
MNTTSYGQYCPLAMSAEFLCNRWTLLVFRELLFGSSNFNDISRGVPRMSRTLLSTRLKELVSIGLVVRHERHASGQVDYVLTDAGKALESVVFAMASWGQEWLETEPSVENVDVSFLMWDIRRNVKILPQLPDPFIVHFFITDVVENKSEHWLVFENEEVDLCYINRGFSVNVKIEVSAKKLTKIWMGWDDFDQAIADKTLKLSGPKDYTDIAQQWLGCSSVAHIKKRAKALLTKQ